MVKPTNNTIISRAELAAMFLNDQILPSDYFEALGITKHIKPSTFWEKLKRLLCRKTKKH